MTERYTDKDCRAYAKLLAEALGKKFGDCWVKVDGKNRSIEGCWDVDYNPVYNGCVITEKSNDLGGERHPLLASRLPPREFCDAVTMARRAVEISMPTKETLKDISETLANIFMESRYDTDFTDEEKATKKIAAEVHNFLKGKVRVKP